MKLGRRAALVGASLAACTACSRREEKPAAPPERSAAPAAPAPVDAGAPATRVVEWTLPWPGGDALAKVVVPTWGAPGERFPVVIALHGRGEALKGPSRGAGGWPDDYAMLRAFERLRAPPIVAADLEDLADASRLEAMNASLRARGFRGVIVACPYVPDLDLQSAKELERYGRALFEVLLPKVRAETPAIATAAATGIDGVSLGGVVALRAGLAHAAELGAIGALQPAIGEWQAGELTEIARAARAKNPAVALRLLTSNDDGYRRPTEALDAAWTKAGLAHEFACVPGPHDYVFNRGPGVYELLTWHDRTLARG